MTTVSGDTAVSEAAAKRRQMPVTLHIIHTNDFHNSLTAAETAKIRDAVAALHGAPYLLLDAGDAIKAGNVGVNPFGEPILDLMSDLGYHAMTMGNREFHVWSGALETKINRARFPILCANVRARKEGAKLPVEPYWRFEVGGLKVVVFGVTVPMVTERMKVASSLSSFVFDDPIETARALVTKLRWEADVLIALTHIGIREDERLAREVSGIDLIVGGHSHVMLAEPQVVNGTPIVQAGWHGKAYGHTTIRVPGSSSDEKSVVTGALHPLKERKEPKRA